MPKQILSLFKHDIIFDYTKNLISTGNKTIKINEFFYSLNQLAILFAVLLFTKSPYRSKVLYFLSGLIVYIFYNSIRISISQRYIPGYRFYTKKYTCLNLFNKFPAMD